MSAPEAVACLQNSPVLFKNPAPIPATALTVLDVDLNAIAHNYHFVVRHIGSTCLCAPVVKANAYGLGMIPVAKRLFHEGARSFFVATPEEGFRLRAALPFVSIYVLSGLWREAAPAFANARLTPVLSNMEALGLWKQEAALLQTQLPSLFQVDTGLVRLGFSASEMEELGNQAWRYEGLSVDALLSHLACAYQPGHPYNLEQRARFEAIRQTFPKTQGSLAGSGALFQDRSYLYDMVRPGRILYGSTFTAPDFFVSNVRPAVTLRARILQVQDVPKGQSVGYDQTFYAERPLRLATLGIGYADGYFRSLSNKASGFIGEHPVPVVGRVSMDLMTVDVTDLPESLAHPGTWVTLIGGPITVDDVADLAGSISWEVLTRLGGRPFFRYHGDIETESIFRNE